MFYLQIIIFDWLLLKQKCLVLLYTSFKVMWNKVVFVWMFIYLQYWVELSNITFYVVCKIVAIVNWCSCCVLLQQILIVLFFCKVLCNFSFSIDWHMVFAVALNKNWCIEQWINYYGPIDEISMFQYQIGLINIDKFANATCVASNMSFFVDQQTFW